MKKKKAVDAVRWWPSEAEPVLAAHAVVALVRGNALILARYIRAADKIDITVFDALVAALEERSSATWPLRFTRRNGRPPKRPFRSDAVTDGEAAAIIREGDAAALLDYLARKRLSVDSYVEALSSVDQAGILRFSERSVEIPYKVRAALADALSSDSKSGWALRFRRMARGNPADEVAAELRLAALGIKALEAYDRGQSSWECVIENVAKTCSTSEGRVRAGVNFLRKSRRRALASGTTHRQETLAPGSPEWTTEAKRLRAQNRSWSSIALDIGGTWQQVRGALSAT